LAREPVVLIIGLAGQAPSRRLRLSSNVERQLSSKPNDSNGSILPVGRMEKLPFTVA